jgi:aminoacrylate hydrolase
MASDVVAVMDSASLQKATIIGHSLGASVALSIALQTPARVDKLVVYAGRISGGPARERIFALRRAVFVSLGPEWHARLTTHLLYPPSYIQSNADTLAKDEARAAQSPPDLAVFDSRARAIAAFSPGNALQRITASSFVICAADDQLTPPECSRDIAALLPKAAVCLLSEGGHAVSRSRPDEFDAAIRRFLG